MTRVKQPRGTRGSLHWMQRFVNERPAELSNAVVTASGGRIEGPIDWHSPLESDDFAEYRDQSFLDRLGVSPSVLPLKEFWPRRGPQWDALGRDGRGCPVLVEAKANLTELNSSPSVAKAESSIDRIRQSLQQTAQHLGASSEADWTRNYYQYTNRLAHLYFLHELNGIKSWLVFLYFVGDTTISEGAGVESAEAWQPAIESLHRSLGLTEHALLNRSVDVFVKVDPRGT